MDLDSGTVVVSPDPINGGGGSDTNNIGKMLLERKFDNGTLVVPSDVVLANKCLSPDANLYHIYLESDDSILPIYETFTGKLIVGVDWDTTQEAINELPENYIFIDGNSYTGYTYIVTVQEFTEDTHRFTEEDGLFTYYEDSDSELYRIMGAAFHYLTIGEDGLDYFVDDVIGPFNISLDTVGTSFCFMGDSPLFQTSATIENPIHKCIFYNIDEDTGWIKTNIGSDIEYIPGKSYISSNNVYIDPSDTSAQWYKFDDGSNFTPITTKQSLYNYLSGANQSKVFTKTDVINEGKNLYIASKFNYYKTVPCVEFLEGKYFYYTGT